MQKEKTISHKLLALFLLAFMFAELLLVGLPFQLLGRIFRR